MVPSPNENLGRGSMGDSNPPNPLQTAYEEFQNKTPFVTRTLIQIMAGSYAASWILGSSVLYGLANISHFTILKGEIYRIFTSSLVNMHFFSLAFAALSFGRHGKHLESAIGSTLFAYHCVFLGVSSNILFIAFNFVMNSVSNDSTYLFDAAAGMWQIIFGAMATECVQAPDTSRRLFFCQVPTALYPLALLGIFVVLGQGLSSGNLLSLALGYALGYGYMDRLKPTQARITRWEESFLVNLTRKSGYIRGDLILGNGAWDEGDDYKGLVSKVSFAPLLE